MTQTLTDLLNASLFYQIGDFTLDVGIEAGEGVTAIIGTSGAGKSSALQAIAGLAKPQAGRVTLGNEVYFDAATHLNVAPERRHIGYVFQEARLFPHLTVAQNLDYGFRRRGGDGAMRRGELIDLLGLTDLLKRYPRHLSGGEAQRVAIGRALLSDPRLLLLDEPMASLDPARRREIMPYIEAMTLQLRMPILLVSHNIDEVARLARRVIVFDRGRVFAQGDVADILNRLDVQRLILGEQEKPELGTIIDTTIIDHDDFDAMTTLAFDGGLLCMSRLNLPVGTPVRLRLMARDIAIATQPPVGHSIQNVLQGFIEDMHESGPGQITLTLQLGKVGKPGTQVQATITARAARKLNLTKGWPIWALIKSVALANEF